MDNLDVVRGPRIENARPLSGGRISVDSAPCNGNGSYNPVIVFQERVYFLSDEKRGRTGRLRYIDITPEQIEFDAIDALSILSGSQNQPVSGKRRYA